MSFGGRRGKQRTLYEPGDVSNQKVDLGALEDRLEVETSEPGCKTHGSHGAESYQGVCVRGQREGGLGTVVDRDEFDSTLPLIDFS